MRLPSVPIAQSWSICCFLVYLPHTYHCQVYWLLISSSSRVNEMKGWQKRPQPTTMATPVSFLKCIYYSWTTSKRTTADAMTFFNKEAILQFLCEMHMRHVSLICNSGRKCVNYSLIPFVRDTSFSFSFLRYDLGVHFGTDVYEYGTIVISHSQYDSNNFNIPFAG